MSRLSLLAPLVVCLSAAAFAAPASAASIAQLGAGTARALAGADEAVVAPDGKNVYVASNDGEWGAIVSFARNPQTGKLTQLPGTTGCMSFDGRTGADDTEPKSCAKVPTVARATDVVVAPDGRTVYTVGSDGFVEALGVWHRDASTGALSPQECFAYAAKFGCQDAPYIEPSKLVMSADGTRLTVGGSSLSTFRVAGDGTLTDPVCSLRFGRSTGGARTACAGTPLYSSKLQISALEGAAESPTRLFAVVDGFNNGNNSRSLVRFALDTASGAITAKGCAGAGRAAAGCGAARALTTSSALAVSPRGSGVYTAGYDFRITDDENGTGFLSGSAIGAFTGGLGQLPGTQGCVLFTGRTNDGCAKRPAAYGSGFRYATAVAVTPDGRYVVGGFNGAVALLKRNTRTQALTPLGRASTCLSETAAANCAPAKDLGSPSDFAFSPDGTFVYVPSDGGLATLRLRR